jgi:DNA-binding PadR family transcriptional regulator
VLAPTGPDDRDPPDLPTTSYAVLGLLAGRDWTGYELAREFQRSLRHCWPKAQSVLYEEPRRLVRAGLAELQVERRGRRSRNRYHITAAGRAVLTKWLAAPSAPPRLEMEPLVRLLLADQGSLEDLRRTVRTLREWSEDNLLAVSPQTPDLVGAGRPSPNRAHVGLLVAQYFAELYELTITWCEAVYGELDN